jgi:NADPH-dependent 2,4-dienoyl-CoA reductase/sulfur reductase-like enzyme
MQKWLPSQYNIFNTMATHASTARDRAIQYFQGLATGPAKPGEATEAYEEIDELAYVLSRVPAFTSRPVKIIAIGAGFSGLALARAIHVGKLPNASVTVYEKNAGVGGTWYENRYPGYVGQFI